jgi:hypothetical protein
VRRTLSQTSAKADDDLVVHIQVAARHETKSFVESGWSGVTKHNARKQSCCALGPHQLGHLADDLGTVSAPLVTLVNEQLPQEPRPDDLRWLRLAIPTDHDEPDGLVARIDGPVSRLGLRILGRVC